LSCSAEVRAWRVDSVTVSCAPPSSPVFPLSLFRLDDVVGGFRTPGSIAEQNQIDPALEFRICRKEE